jgi:putative ABC transport system ATP-binding protein
MIEIKNLHRTYRQGKIETHALRGIDLYIDKGEFTAIVGASGSGKTTLLNIIGGLDRPTLGEVSINHTYLHHLNTIQLTRFRLYNIGFVFQSFNLVPVLSAEENVALILQLQKRRARDVSRISKEMLEMVGLKDKLKSRPSELSGGQQQRVAIARALATNPAFVLADEPTANLDSGTAEEILDLMLQLNQVSEVTFIFSTHDQRIMQKARRLVQLKDGKIESQKTIEI